MALYYSHEHVSYVNSSTGAEKSNRREGGAIACGYHDCLGTESVV